MEDIKKFVNYITKKFYTTNPTELCQSFGIELLKDYLQPIKDYLQPIKGYYTKSNRIKIITIDYDLDEKEKDIVISHELGHALLHKDISTTFFHKFTKFSTDKIENEANIFAMYLTLKRYEDEIEDIYNLDEISNITGLNINLLYKYYKK